MFRRIGPGGLRAQFLGRIRRAPFIGLLRGRYHVSRRRHAWFRRVIWRGYAEQY
jgi:hypothetical protein